MFKNAQLEEKGINIDGEKLSNLRFADDVALRTEDVKDMEHQLNTVNEESSKLGNKIHNGKTKFMTNIDTTDNIQINGTEIGLYPVCLTSNDIWMPNTHTTIAN